MNRSNIPATVLAWTSGKRVLIIGGDRREHSERHLRTHLGFKTVDWCTTRESDASDWRFKSMVSAERYDLVVALVGLLRTHHVPAIRRLASAHHLPLVVLRRSPSVQRVAEAVTHHLERGREWGASRFPQARRKQGGSDAPKHVKLWGIPPAACACVG